MLQTLSRVTVVPVTAVNRGPKGPFVFVVGPGGKAIMRPVSVGETQGELAMVKSGVQPGDTVVIDGQMTLKNGSRVRIAKVQAGTNAP